MIRVGLPRKGGNRLAALRFHEGAVLSGGHAGHAAEVLDHVAAVGVAGLPADGFQVQVGIGQVLLHGLHTELFNALLAADAEIVVEALGEPGIAEGTAGTRGRSGGLVFPSLRIFHSLL